MALKTTLLATKVTPDIAARFISIASQHGGVSNLLRSFIERVVGKAGGAAAVSIPKGRVLSITIHLNPDEYAEIKAAADEVGMPMSGFLRAAVSAWRTKRPQWDAEGVETLRQLGEALRQIALAADGAGGEAAAEAANQIRRELAGPLAEIVRRNVNFWNPGIR